MKLYRKLASLVDARIRCLANQGTEWVKRHTQAIGVLVAEHCPSGAGFDNGTKLDLDRSTGEKLVFDTSFHHMNDGGYYDGWSEHTVAVVASLLSGFDLRISGRDRNDIKEYIAETFQYALDQEVNEK